jgi:hypothetical protein
MSYLDGPKYRFTSIASALAASASAHSSHHLKPGCVQCGSLLDLSECRTSNFSGKCFSCENWIMDEEEIFDDLED